MQTILNNFVSPDIVGFVKLIRYLVLILTKLKQLNSNFIFILSVNICWAYFVELNNFNAIGDSEVKLEGNRKFHFVKYLHSVSAYLILL